MNRLHILIVHTKSAYGQSLDEETTLTGAVPGIANGKWKTSPRNVVRYITIARSLILRSQIANMESFYSFDTNSIISKFKWTQLIINRQKRPSLNDVMQKKVRT